VAFVERRGGFARRVLAPVGLPGEVVEPVVKLGTTTAEVSAQMLLAEPLDPERSTLLKGFGRGELTHLAELARRLVEPGEEVVSLGASESDPDIAAGER
jgi:hypothetical protein